MFVGSILILSDFWKKTEFLFFLDLFILQKAEHTVTIEFFDPDRATLAFFDAHCPFFTHTSDREDISATFKDFYWFFVQNKAEIPKFTNQKIFTPSLFFHSIWIIYMSHTKPFIKLIWRKYPFNIVSAYKKGLFTVGIKSLAPLRDLICP